MIKQIKLDFLLVKERKFLIHITLFLGLFFLADNISADALVQSISGDTSSINISQNGQTISVKPLSRLQSGDIVTVNDESAVISLLFNDMTVVDVNSKLSPYVIADEGGDSMVGELMENVSSYYLSLFSEEDAFLVSAITRGKGAPINIMGMELVNNVVKGTKSVQIFWQETDGLYEIKLEDMDGKLIRQYQSNEGSQQIDLDLLTVGHYKVNVSDSKTNDERSLSIVNGDNELPLVLYDTNGESLLGVLSPKMTSLIFAAYPEWHFSAIQYAWSSEEHRLFNSLLEDRTWYSFKKEAGMGLND